MLKIAKILTSGAPQHNDIFPPFQSKQVGYHSMAVMAFFNMLKHALAGRPDLLMVWWKGRRRGRRAAYLLAADWERLLTLPLEKAQRELDVEPVEPYRVWNYPPELRTAANV